MRSLLRLRRFIHPYWSQVLLALAALVLMTAISLTIPLIIREVIDEGLVNQDAQLLEAIQRQLEDKGIKLP